MATERYELKNSQAQAEHWGARVNRVEFVVDDTASPSADTIQTSLCSTTGYGGISAIPGHPLKISANTDGTGTMTVQYLDAAVRTVNVQLEPNGAGQVRITIGLTQYGTFTDQTDPIRVTTSTKLQPTQAYRSGPIIPADTWVADGATGYYDADVTLWDGSSGSSTLNALAGSVDANGAESSTYRPAGDIGGDPIDWNGNPIAVGLPVTRIEVEVLRWGPYIDSSGGYAMDSDSLETQQLGVGARNQALFCTFPQGNVLYEGVQRSPLDAEWYVARYSFLAHPWKHAIQVPRPTFGTSIGAMSYEGDPRSIRHYRGVYWQQAYLRGYDFNDLFTADEQAALAVL